MLLRAVVLPIFCAPFDKELTGEEIRSAMQQHTALETEDQVRAITSTSDSPTDITVEQEAKQASDSVHRPAETPDSVRWAKNFWTYAPPAINGVTAFCLSHVFPQLFEYHGPGFPGLNCLGFFLSVVPGVTLYEMRPRFLFKTARSSHQL
ncbi:putative signal peptide protein [Puccinia sorghi]|uniref:Putative signal peptide protein n=1 Tax=Puccinia sorghi TaxID=27349 RepID=A0A0L6V5H2_9BASI|nr:putative signal peptide protein [Puccinia sorghi]